MSAWAGRASTLSAESCERGRAVSLPAKATESRRRVHVVGSFAGAHSSPHVHFGRVPWIALQPAPVTSNAPQKNGRPVENARMDTQKTKEHMKIIGSADKSLYFSGADVTAERVEYASCHVAAPANVRDIPVNLIICLGDLAIELKPIENTAWRRLGFEPRIWQESSDGCPRPGQVKSNTKAPPVAALRRHRQKAWSWK